MEFWHGGEATSLRSENAVPTSSNGRYIKIQSKHLEKQREKLHELQRGMKKAIKK